MNRKYYIKPVLLSLVIVLVAGCTPYVVTTPLKEPLENDGICCIGSITDELPIDMEEEDKPTLEEIEKFKDHLYNEINRKGVLEMAGCGGSDTRYEVSGSVIEFKRGSGVARFVIGFGVGNAKMVTSLRLVDVVNDQTVFAGNFPAQVSDWMTKSDEIFKTIARNFAKAVEKQQKKALKNK